MLDISMEEDALALSVLLNCNFSVQEDDSPLSDSYSQLSFLSPISKTAHSSMPRMTAAIPYPVVEHMGATITEEVDVTREEALISPLKALPVEPSLSLHPLPSELTVGRITHLTLSFLRRQDPYTRLSSLLFLYRGISSSQILYTLNNTELRLNRKLHHLLGLEIKNSIFFNWAKSCSDIRKAQTQYTKFLLRSTLRRLDETLIFRKLLLKGKNKKIDFFYSFKLTKRYFVYMIGSLVGLKVNTAYLLFKYRKKQISRGWKCWRSFVRLQQARRKINSRYDMAPVSRIFCIWRQRDKIVESEDSKQALASAFFQSGSGKKALSLWRSWMRKDNTEVSWIESLQRRALRKLRKRTQTPLLLPFGNTLSLPSLAFNASSLSKKNKSYPCNMRPLVSFSRCKFYFALHPVLRKVILSCEHVKPMVAIETHVKRRRQRLWTAFERQLLLLGLRKWLRRRLLRLTLLAPRLSIPFPPALSALNAIETLKRRRVDGLRRRTLHEIAMEHMFFKVQRRMQWFLTCLRSLVKDVVEKRKMVMRILSTSLNFWKGKTSKSKMNRMNAMALRKGRLYSLLQTWKVATVEIRLRRQVLRRCLRLMRETRMGLLLQRLFVKLAHRSMRAALKVWVYSVNYYCDLGKKVELLHKGKALWGSIRCWKSLAMATQLWRSCKQRGCFRSMKLQAERRQVEENQQRLVELWISGFALRRWLQRLQKRKFHAKSLDFYKAKRCWQMWEIFVMERSQNRTRYAFLFPAAPRRMMTSSEYSHGKRPSVPASNLPCHITVFSQSKRQRILKACLLAWHQSHIQKQSSRSVSLQHSCRSILHFWREHAKGRRVQNNKITQTLRLYFVLKAFEKWRRWMKAISHRRLQESKTAHLLQPCSKALIKAGLQRWFQLSRRRAFLMRKSQEGAVFYSFRLASTVILTLRAQSSTVR